MELKFPDGFFWGSATSAHQVEGGNFNDWTEWEHANSERLAAEAASRHAKTHMRIPDYILERYPNPLQPENYISGKACDHYHLYEQDFDIAKQLGQNAHRFSIEWSRIEPEEGKFNEAEIEHYRKVIAALKDRGIEPFVTLWHWANPLWFAKKGGWENRDSVRNFAKFVDRVVGEFKDTVNFWIPLNEPWVYISHSYLRGIWSPEKKSLYSCFKVLKNLISAHRSAFNIIKSFNLKAQVGIAENNIYFEGWLHSLAHWWDNQEFLFGIKKRVDFIGLNYYFRIKIKGFKAIPAGHEISDLGWDIFPRGIYRQLKEWRRYKKPLFIIENGVADAKDEKRTKFIREHLYWIQKAISKGADVRGYFYWSLLDNFEWDKGFWPRFGLVEVDYETLERKIRPSAWEYAKICRENCLKID